MRFISLIVTVGVLIVVLATCNTRPLRQAVPCEEVAENSLRSLTFDEMDLDAMPEWIATNFNVEDSAIERFDVVGDPDYLTLAWEVQRGETYYAHFDGPRLLFVQRALIGNSVPTGKNLIDCLGEPSLYRATMQEYSVGRELLLEPWYPEQGMLVEFFDLHPPFKTDPMEDMPVKRISFVRPGSVEEMTIDLTRDPDLEAPPLKPWPGAWEDMEVGTE